VIRERRRSVPSGRLRRSSFVLAQGRRGLLASATRQGAGADRRRSADRLRRGPGSSPRSRHRAFSRWPDSPRSEVRERLLTFEEDMVEDFAWCRVRTARRRDHNVRASPISRSVPGIAFAAEAMSAAGVRHVGQPTEAGIGTELRRAFEPRFGCRHATAARARPTLQAEGLGVEQVHGARHDVHVAHLASSS
jgi:hypothetical protein